MEQGRRGFRDFRADKGVQRHQCHSREAPTGEDRKRTSLLRGPKDRTRAVT